MGFTMLCLARVVRQYYPAQYFGKIPGFNLWKLKLSRLSGVFPPLVDHFFKRVREREVKLRYVVYEVWLVSYLLSSFQIWYFWKWIIMSIGLQQTYESYMFQPLMSFSCDSTKRRTKRGRRRNSLGVKFGCQRLHALRTRIFLNFFELQIDFFSFFFCKKTTFFHNFWECQMSMSLFKLQICIIC